MFDRLLQTPLDIFTPAYIYPVKVNNRNTRTRCECEICSKLTIKTQDRRQWCRYAVLIVNFTPCSSVSLVNFEHVIAGWDAMSSKTNQTENLKKKERKPTKTKNQIKLRKVLIKK